MDPAKLAEYDAARRPGASQPDPVPRTKQQRARREEARRAYFQRRVRAATNPRSTWNYYDVLGIPHDANEETIVRSYERLYREFYHGSDVDPGTAAILQEVIDARELLTDPAKREAYDRIPSDRQPSGRSQQQSTSTGRGRTEGAGRAEAPSVRPRKEGGLPPRPPSNPFTRINSIGSTALHTIGKGRYLHGHPGAGILGLVLSERKRKPITCSPTPTN